VNEQMGHQHDLELIAALVEGRLDDPMAAEALAAACDECGAHRDYLTVLAAVAADPSPPLDDFERQGLRSAVWHELSLPTRAAPTRRGVSWPYRIASVAAAMVLVIGIGAVLGDRSGDDIGVLSVDNLQRATVDEASDTVGAAEMQPSADDSGIMSDAPAEAEDSDVDERFILPGLDEVPDAVADFRRVATEGLVHDLSVLAEDCVAADGLAAQPAFFSARGAVGPEAVEFVALGTGDEVEAVVVYRSDDCTVVHRE
jgi:hypothetical protein